MTTDEIKAAIDALTQAIVENANHDQFDDMDCLIDQRNVFITAFIALVPGTLSPEALSAYFKKIIQADQYVAEMITQQRNLIKKTLLSFDSLREYSNV